LPKAKTASAPVVGRIIDFGRRMHSHVIDGRPFFKHYPQWAKALQQLLERNVRAEQQAFAKFDLNFVIDGYTPGEAETA
jgi:DNA topoisomerase VI subunit A